VCVCEVRVFLRTTARTYEARRVALRLCTLNPDAFALVLIGFVRSTDDDVQLIPESLGSSLLAVSQRSLCAERPCANSKHKDAKRLMRATRVKPSNTNALTTINLEGPTLLGSLKEPPPPRGPFTTNKVLKRA